MEEEEATLVVEAVSAGFLAGNRARITINNTIVKVEKNENNHFRGFHIAVITPRGSIECAKVFDTYGSSANFEAFIQKPIPDDYIIAAACKDEGATKLSEAVKQWFADMGSKQIWGLGYRQGFAFIGRTGCNESTEKKAIIPDQEVVVQQIFTVDDPLPNEETAGFRDTSDNMRHGMPQRNRGIQHMH